MKFIKKLLRNNSQEYQYLDLLEDILENGIDSDDRTGTGTKSVFGRQIRFDLQKGFPLLTTKKIHWKSVVVELLWLMGGHTNISFLKKHNVRIWDEWADEKGDLGPVYGQQWRAWEDIKHIPANPQAIIPYKEYYQKGHLDQLTWLIDRIKKNPNCRRLIVSAWNAPMIPQMKLPPCHTLFQFYVRNGKLSCHLYQRSADVFLGVPFNIASYALLTHLIAKECGLDVGEFVHSFGDVHIYNNHIEQVKEQLKRKPRKFPKLHLDPEFKGNLMMFVDKLAPRWQWDQIDRVISVSDYKPHPGIKGQVSV